MILFLVLGAVYIQQTPYRQAGKLVFQGGAPAQDIGAPDERQHANYVARLLRGEGFAVLDPKDPNLYENYQAHQPPLYYVVAAGWSLVTGTDPQNRETGPRLRWLSLLMGLGTLAGLWWLVRWGTGSDLAAHAGAAVGLMPMFVALHGAVSNDPLLFLLMTWSCALMVRTAKLGLGAKEGLVLGVLMGLAMLTKTTAVALLPLALLAAILGGRSSWGGLAIGVGLSLLLVGGWWVRNMGVYGDPLALKAFQESFTGSAQASMFIQEFGAWGYWTQWVMWWTGRSLVGAFGYMDIYLFEGLGQARFNQIYLAILFVLAIPFVAGWIGLLGAKRDEDEEAADQPWTGFGWLMAGLVGVVFLLFVQFNRTYFQGQARYLYPAVGAFAAAMGAGMIRLTENRSPSLGWGVLAGVLALLNVAALSGLGEAFARRMAG
jgi:4-amino-4-deoxy-L-arabinose transferase-like glycosyltransferase